MRCPKCGFEVDSNDVFCPNCSSPLRVTADYDFIQAEIGGKVDQYLSDDFELENDDSIDDPIHSEFTIDAIDINRPKRNRTSSNIPEETIAITRTIYGQDTIYQADDLLEYPVDDEREEEISKEDLEYKKKRARARAKAKAKKKKMIILICSIAAAVVVVVGLILGLTLGGGKKKKTEIKDTIECNLKDGETYTTPLSINIASKSNYRLFYTLDGTDPTITSTKFGQAIQIDNKNYSEYVKDDTGELTLKVVSFNDSSVKAGTLTIKFILKRAAVSAPIIEPASGDYSEPTNIKITADSDAAIYYTFDGSIPTTASSRYDTPVPMKRGNFVFNAIAIDSSGIASEVTSCVYNLYIDPKVSFAEAESNVLDYLLDRGLIESKTPASGNEYPVPGGGARRLTSSGEATIDNDVFYVFQVDYMNEDKSIQSTTYLGVDDQNGSISSLSRSGDKYIKS